MNATKFFRSFTLAAILAVSGVAWGQPSAKGFVMSKQSELTVLVKDKSPASSKKVEALFDEILDYDALARASLDRYWEERTEAERAEFKQVLKDLVRRSYRKNLDKTAGYEVAIEGETKLDRGHLVRTTARSKTNVREEPLAIDYVVTNANGKWLITDIVTEGSSLVTNYKRQFGRIIKSKGFDELLRRMKGKLGDE